MVVCLSVMALRQPGDLSRLSHPVVAGIGSCRGCQQLNRFNIPLKMSCYANYGVTGILKSFAGAKRLEKKLLTWFIFVLINELSK